MIKGFACGVFDLYHPGHVLMLRDCKKHCDHLTLALNRSENFSDHINPGKRKPFFSLDERRLVMQSIKYVDEIIDYETEEELTKIMLAGGFDLRFLGDDYQGKPITAAKAIPRIIYLDRSHGYSTSELVRMIRTSKL
ncbi:MAG: adenylyltransferase/cytidyltransferase family protein [Flavobacteriales bacterium]|nr:adenylyltransferase/cytidyltransferase family protein [Flavobacteriales bacterium]